MKKSLFLLVLLVLGVGDFKTKAALPPQESPEPVLPTFPLPPELEEHILSYVVAELKTKPYFIEAVKFAEPLASVNRQFKDIAFNVLVSRFKNASDAQGELFRLMYPGKLRPLALEILKKAGASLEKEDPSGFTPLVFALTRGHTGVALMLIDKGADVNKAASRDGSYPIEAATILYGDSVKNAERVVTAMINAGVDLKIKDAGKRLLLEAIDSNDEPMIQLLFLKGVEPNFSRKIVETLTSPLESAINKGNFKLVKLLLEKGADPNYKSSSGAPIEIAHRKLEEEGDTPKTKERAAIVEILKEKGAKE